MKPGLLAPANPTQPDLNKEKKMRDTYRTSDGQACFDFRFVDERSHYEIDILSTAVRTLSQAKRIAKAWAEQTWRYIKTGRSFAGS